MKQLMYINKKILNFKTKYSNSKPKAVVVKKKSIDKDDKLTSVGANGVRL